MSAERRPVEILWEHLTASARSRAGDPEALERLLDERLRAAREAWRGIDVPDAIFVPYLAARIEGAPSPAEALRALHVDDLYLACACVEGHRAALSAFDARYIAGLDASLGRTIRQGVQMDDIKQALRQKLFVGDRGGRPKLADYAGRGDVRRWVRAAALRAVIDAARSEKEIPTEDELLGAIELGGDNPEMANLKEASRAEFKAAFRDALGSLGDRERLLLLQYYLDGSTLEALAALYGVVPSTISRSLAKARATLLARVRPSLMARMRISGQEVDSLVRLIQSQFELTTNLIEGHRRR